MMSLSESQLVFASVAFEKDKAKAADLCRFMSSNIENSLTEELSRMDSTEGKTSSGELFYKLLAFRKPKKGLMLGEMHPGWILERLKGESPYLLGMVCRYLSDDKVKYIIDHCDPKVQGWLRSNRNGVLFPEELSEWIWDTLEEQFSAAPLPERKSRFSFQHFGHLSAADLEVLFRDLGMEEACKIFQGTPKKVISVLLRRLPVQEARELRYRLKEAKELPADLRHQSRLDFLKLPIESSAENFFLEVGLSVFAKAVAESDNEWVEHLAYKMSPEQGFLLKRMISDVQQKKEDSDCLARQEYVLSRFVRLMSEGRTEQTYWSTRPEDEDTKVLDVEAA